MKIIDMDLDGNTETITNMTDDLMALCEAKNIWDHLTSHEKKNRRILVARSYDEGIISDVIWDSDKWQE